MAGETVSGDRWSKSSGYQSGSGRDETVEHDSQSLGPGTERHADQTRDLQTADFTQDGDRIGRSRQPQERLLHYAPLVREPQAGHAGTGSDDVFH